MPLSNPQPKHHCKQQQGGSNAPKHQFCPCNLPNRMLPYISRTNGRSSMLRCDYHRFTSKDVNRMLELSRELYEMPPGFLLRVERMLRRLCNIIGAQVAIFSDLKHYLPGHKWEIKPLLDFGWAGPAERATFMSFFEGEQLDDPLTLPCARLRSTATASRQQ